MPCLCRHRTRHFLKPRPQATSTIIEVHPRECLEHHFKSLASGPPSLQSCPVLAHRSCPSSPWSKGCSSSASYASSLHLVASTTISFSRAISSLLLLLVLLLLLLLRAGAASGKTECGFST